MDKQMSLGRVNQKRRTGSERFRSGGQELAFDLLDFWQWSCSDFVSNTSRGVLAEYIVARALGIVGGIRNEWAAFDLETPEGIRVEVKSAAFLQSWHQEKLSSISFGVRKTRSWNPETNKLSDEPQRPADVYVFALLAHRDKPTLNPMDLSQWEFYVLPSRVLDQRQRSQHSITLRSLRASTQAVGYQGLHDAVQLAVKA